MSRPISRRGSNSGSRERAMARLATRPPLRPASARWSCASSSAWRALSLNEAVVGFTWYSRGTARASRRGTAAFSTLCNRRLTHFSGQHLRHVPSRDRPALAAQLAGHVHETAEIASEQEVGLGGRHIRGLLLYHRVRYVRGFDRKGAPVPAADLCISHFLEF